MFAPAAVPWFMDGIRWEQQCLEFGQKYDRFGRTEIQAQGGSKLGWTWMRVKLIVRRIDVVYRSCNRVNYQVSSSTVRLWAVHPFETGLNR